MLGLSNRVFSISSVVLGLVSFVLGGKPVVQVIDGNTLGKQAYSAFYNRKPMSVGFTKDARVVLISSTNNIWIDGEEYSLAAPDTEMVGSLRISENGKYVAGIFRAAPDEKPMHYSTLRWDLSSALGGVLFSQPILGVYKVLLKKEVPAPSMYHLTPSGDVVVRHRGKDIVAVNSHGKSYKDKTVRVHDTQRYSPFLHCHKVVSEGIADEGNRPFLLGADGEERLLPGYRDMASGQGTINVIVGTCEKKGDMDNSSLQEDSIQKYYIWNENDHKYDEHQINIAGVPNLCGGNILGTYVCNVNTSLVYAHCRGENKLSFLKYELDSDEKRCLPTEFEFEQYDDNESKALGENRGVLLAVINSVSEDRIHCLLDLCAEGLVLKDCRELLNELLEEDKKLREGEWIEDVLYSGPGKGIESGAYLFILRDREDRVRFVKVSYPPAIEALEPITSMHGCLIPCAATSDGARIIGYEKGSNISCLRGSESQIYENLEVKAMSRDGKYIVGNTSLPSSNNEPTEKELLAKELLLEIPVGQLITSSSNFPLIPLEEANSSTVYAVDSSGGAFGESIFLNGRTKPCVWTFNPDSQKIDVKGLTVPFGADGSCLGTNDEGQILIGQLSYKLYAGDVYRACVWQEGNCTELPVIQDGDKYAYPSAVACIRNRTITVGCSGMIDGFNIGGKACFWVDGKIHPLFSGDEQRMSIATCIVQDKGWILGVVDGEMIHHAPEIKGGQGFIYCGPKTGIQDLKEWLICNYEGLEEELVDWTLDHPRWVSPNGQLILGVGTYKGCPKAFKIDLSLIERLTDEDDGDLVDIPVLS